MRLFPELAVDDPPMGEEQFVREIVPTMLVVEGSEGPHPAKIAGYAYFQLMKGLAYVRHVVTAPGARRTGVGRTLMGAIAARAREAGCTAWCLNVKLDNTAAIALYERVGMARGFTTQVLIMDWANVGPADAEDETVLARLIEPEDDARVEPPMKLVDGQLAIARASRGGRVLMGLFERRSGGAVGATVFDPSHPGAYPFRAARPELAPVLLRAIRPSKRPHDDVVNVVVEGQPEIGAALLASGARLKLDIQHMLGPLPAP